MRYYPVFLDIRNRPCLVVGAGQVGTRKVKGLLKCSARVNVVSPTASDEMKALARVGAITYHARSYQMGDVAGMFLVISATDDEKLNIVIHRDAEKLHIPCNIADRPQLCSFILPAVIQQGDLILAVSTSGRSPALARRIREMLQEQFGEEYGQLLLLMGAIRKRLLAENHAPEAHKSLFEQLLDEGLLQLVRENRYGAIDSLLKKTLGPGFRFDELMPSERAEKS